MTNEEYVRRLGLLYNEVLDFSKDGDYTINQPQMEKLIAVVEFFLDTAQEGYDSVELVQLVPREEHGGVIATFLVFDIYNEKVQRFCEVMKACSAISIDSCDKGVCISCTVPNVFVSVKK